MRLQLLKLGRLDRIHQLWIISEVRRQPNILQNQNAKNKKSIEPIWDQFGNPRC